MNIVIKKKKKYLAQKKDRWWVGLNPWASDPESNSINRFGSVFLGFQIKYKYKRRVDQGAKGNAVRVLLI